MLKIQILIAITIIFSGCVQEVVPIEEALPENDVITEPTPIPVPTTPVEIVAIAPTLICCYRIRR